MIPVIPDSSAMPALASQKTAPNAPVENLAFLDLLGASPVGSDPKSPEQPAQVPLDEAGLGPFPPSIQPTPTDLPGGKTVPETGRQLPNTIASPAADTDNALGSSAAAEPSGVEATKTSQPPEDAPIEIQARDKTENPQPHDPNPAIQGMFAHTTSLQSPSEVDEEIETKPEPNGKMAQLKGLSRKKRGASAEFPVAQTSIQSIKHPSVQNARSVIAEDLDALRGASVQAPGSSGSLSIKSNGPPKKQASEPDRAQPAMPSLSVPSPTSMTPIQPAIVLPQPLADTSMAAAASTPRIEAQLGQQIEAAIEHLTDAREAARSSRPEMSLRHQEFGSVTMRLEAAGSDLRATLSSRDPGFVPAVQAALAERALAPATEGGAAQSNRGSDQQGQNPAANSGSGQSTNAGAGAFADQRYGSSTGSGQGPYQPYRDQTERSEKDRSTDQQPSGPEAGFRGQRDEGLFA